MQCVSKTFRRNLRIPQLPRHHNSISTFSTNPTPNPNTPTNFSNEIDNSYRTFNFSAGPACIDTEIMYQAQAEFTNYNGTGMGIIEMSHRDADGIVQQTIENSSHLIRELLNVPSNYHIFFMAGGAHGQFSAVPLNLAKKNNKNVAGYVNAGHWSQRARNEASKIIDTVEVASCEQYDNYNSIVPTNMWQYSNDMLYIHLCANETIQGLEYFKEPELPDGAPPLVGDFTSTFFSRKIDISKYGVVYASGGKNFGPAGVTIVIARDDLVLPRSERGIEGCPGILDYYEFIHSQPIHSIWNTPPVFQIYMTYLTLQKYKKMCMTEDGKINMQIIGDWTRKRSNKIYDIIDNSNGFYINNVKKQNRSDMNVPFRIGNKNNKDSNNSELYDVSLEKKFTEIAEKEYGLQQLFGHPLFGGQRVTLYNPVPDAAVDKCAQFMTEFMEAHMKMQ